MNDIYVEAFFTVSSIVHDLGLQVGSVAPNQEVIGFDANEVIFNIKENIIEYDEDKITGQQCRSLYGIAKLNGHKIRGFYS
jgi:hypothetical protein